MSKTKLYEKMVAVMIKVGQMGKGGEIKDSNDKHMYYYLSEEVTTATLQKAFTEYGLVMFPIKVESEVVELRGLKYDKESLTAVTKVIVTYKICCIETGEFEELQSIGYGADSQDKGSNKAMTSAFKYVQRQTFMISTGEDADHTGSHEIDAKQDKSSQTQRTAPQTNPNTNSQPLRTVATGQTGQSNDVISDGQRKMLYAKHNQSFLKGSFDRISDHLGYPVTKFEEVKRADVNKLIALLDENKAS